MRRSLSSLAAAGAIALALSVAPNSASAQAKASVCKDGTTSTTAGKGACTGHGGVDAAKTKVAASSAKTAATASKDAAKPAATKPAPATKVAASTPAPNAMAAKTTPAKKDAAATKKDVASSAGDKDPKDATAECKDGTYSHAKSHSGACSGHGGVSKFLK